MDCQGPTTAVRAAAVPASVGSSRLAQMQMRFQQRQQQERDQRKIEQIATRTTVAAATTTVVAASNGRTSTSTTTTATATATATSSSSAASGGAVGELTERLNATSLSSSLGAGKVRQMFEERRHHRVAGIDKSYPLQPIQAKAGGGNGAAPSTVTATTLANIANGNHSITSTTTTTTGTNNNNIPNGAVDGAPSVGRSGSIARGGGAGTATSLNNKPRVPPISATSRNRLQQQTHRANASSLRQEQQVTRSTSNVGDATHPTTEHQGQEDGGFDDNDNFLELEKFPDSGELDGELLYNQVNNNVHHLGATSANGTGTTRTAAQNVNSLKLKPVPGRSATTTTTPARSSTLKKQPSVTGSGKSGATTATHRATKSNGPSRTVTQPSPASSAGSVRRVSSTPPERSERSMAAMLTAASSAPSAATAVDGPVPEGLARCDICSRNFADDRIEKHRTICQKTKAKKRKVFDVTKQRVAGTEAEKYVLKARGKGAAGAARKQSSQQQQQQSGAAGAGKQSNWRKKHEEFIATIRAAKELKAHLAKGGKLSDLPPPPPSENPDYVQCPHCSRRFNQTAADRHIPKCATMLHNKPKPKPKASTSTMRRY
ncbi:mucin-21 [Anopheles aquasalis]|uniref:mucin-21 n=1 Tax=Anopheles aquasalis TaxID=42839 RepID=UPI00215AE3B7|nr:mucin-21 [Anopheles aquasalis]XP_050083709.1 mucin-21 [Anopheles aquasalis]